MVATERGGQVTYHGPGQVVAYLLLDLRRRKLGVRELVFVAAMKVGLRDTDIVRYPVFDPGGLEAYLAFLSVLLRLWTIVGELMLAGVPDGEWPYGCLSPNTVEEKASWTRNIGLLMRCRSTLGLCMRSMISTWWPPRSPTGGTAATGTS